MQTRKNIVITGATSGIGKALCECFAQENNVFAGYRNERFVEDLRQISPDIVPFYIDMKLPNSINAAADFIKNKVTYVDVLINAAGCVVAGAMENLDISRIKEQFDVNTFGHLEFTQNILPLLDGGKIINISSMASFGIFPFVGPYCASKRALDILFNSLILETHRDIKLVSVKPGVIATPLWEKSIEENCASFNSAQGFEKELNYMLKNAKKNGKEGLDVQKVVKLISKICNSSSPKLSYTVGRDAKVAEIISKLSPNLINKIIRCGMFLKGLRR